MNLDRTLLTWARPAWKWIALATLSGWGQGLLALGMAWLLSSLVAGVFLDGKDLRQSLPALTGLLAVFLGRALLAWAQEAAGVAAAVDVKQTVLEKLLAHLRSVGPAGLSAQAGGEVIATAIQGVEALDGFYSQYLPQIFLAISIPLSLLIVIAPIDPLSGLIFLLTAPLIPLFMVLIGRAAEQATRQQYSTLGKISAYFLDTLQGLTTLKQLNQSQARVEAITSLSQVYRQRTMQVLRLTFLSALALELAATLSTAVIAVEIGLRLLAGQLEFQAAFFILILAPEFYQPLRLLGQRFHAGAAGAAGAQRILALMSLPVPVRSARESLPWPVGKMECVECKGVRYQYAGRQEAALDDIHLALRAGEITALIGESGAGKSTLAQLLLGFLNPQAGKITVNGIDLAQLDLETWRNCLAWVPQQPTIFHGTLAENIRLGKADASVEEVWAAARDAGLENFIRAQPDGLETRVGEEGARLSGGQAQRLALARGLIRQAPVVLLDEPTTYLDPRLERELMATIAAISQERIVLLIAHHPAALDVAQRVIVMSAGKIIEQGTPVELRARGSAWLDAMLAGSTCP